MDLDPKYVSRLIETRLYAIREKKHIDGAVITFYCPKCSHNNTVMKPLFYHSLTMDSFMQAVSGYRNETHRCVCGEKLGHKNIIMALYSHFFKDSGYDFQAEVTTASNFVTFYRMDMEGRRDLISKPPDCRTMQEYFSQVLSVRECWRSMLAIVRQAKSIQTLVVEPGYTILAIPGDTPHSNVRIRELLGPGWPGESAMTIYLREMENARIEHGEYYPIWMPEFAGDIKKGGIDAIAVIDLSAVLSRLESSLAAEGADFVIEGGHFKVVKKPFQKAIAIKEIARDSALTGKSMSELASERADVALAAVTSAEYIYRTITGEMPAYSFTVSGDYLEVTNPRNGQSDTVDLYAAPPKGGPRTIVARLQESLNRNEKFRPVCSVCGKEGLIVKHIEPASWLRQPGHEDSFNNVYDERENAVVLYSVSCGEHVTPIKKTDLAAWLVDRATLDQVFEKELDSLRINIEAHAKAYGKDLIIGVLSGKACDIMVHPAFVKSLYQALGVDLGPRVIAYAPFKEIVLVYREDAAMGSLNDAVADLQRMAASKGLSQTLLDYIELFDVGEAHGVISLGEIAAIRQP